jgi:hypothetical protein
MHHAWLLYTVIHFVWVSAKFGTCTVGSVNETLVEDKLRRFKGEYAHFSFNKCPIYTHDGASAKFSTNSHTKQIQCTCAYTDISQYWCKTYIMINLTVGIFITKVRLLLLFA